MWWAFVGGAAAASLVELAAPVVDACAAGQALDPAWAAAGAARVRSDSWPGKPREDVAFWSLAAGQPDAPCLLAWWADVLIEAGAEDARVADAHKRVALSLLAEDPEGAAAALRRAIDRLGAADRPEAAASLSVWLAGALRAAGDLEGAAATLQDLESNSVRSQRELLREWARVDMARGGWAAAEPRLWALLEPCRTDYCAEIEAAQLMVEGLVASDRIDEAESIYELMLAQGERALPGPQPPDTMASMSASYASLAWEIALADDAPCERLQSLVEPRVPAGAASSSYSLIWGIATAGGGSPHLPCLSALLERTAQAESGGLLSDPGDHALGLYLRAMQLSMLGAPMQAYPLLVALWELPGEQLAGPSRGLLAAQLSGNGLARGDLRAARHWLERAQVHADRTEFAELRSVAGAEVGLRVEQGDFLGAQAVVAELDRVRLGFDLDPATVETEAWFVAQMRVDAGDAAGALPVLRAFVEDIEQRRAGDPAFALLLELARVRLGVALYQAGDPEEAEHFLAAGLPLVGDHPLWNRNRQVPRWYHALADIRLRSKDIDGAREAAEAALRIAKGLPGDPSYRISESLLLLATVEQADGRQADARRLALDGARLAHEAVDPLLTETSQRERFALLRDRRAALDQMLSILDQPGDAKLAWEQLLAWKGAVRRSLVQQSALARADRRPEVLALRSELDEQRQRVAEILVEGDSAGALSKTTEELERRLAQTLAASTAPPTVAALCLALPSGSALVDLVRYQRVTGGGRDAYAAFVVTGADCQVVRVELDDADGIDRDLDRWLDRLSTPAALTNRIDRAGKTLRRDLWDPIEAASQGATRLWIAPDGPLATLPWAALPGRDGYLIETREISVLALADDILAEAAPSGSGALVVGGVDYGGELLVAATDDAVLRSARCVNRPFSPLPATTEEAAAVAGTLEQPTLLQGSAATEQAVRAGLPGSRIVHFATHGFFAGDDCPSALADPEGYHPLVRSGVVLAGADHPQEGGHDGILTAEEIATLDLSGVELVVLSACETGLGRIADGEGVLGLRWAVGVAGGRYVLSSLWSVEDVPTKALMIEFYRRLSAGAPAAEALRQAQLARLAESRSSLGEARPQHWAAFVLAGPPATPP